MAKYKVTWIFEAYQQQTGTTASAAPSWSETWYIESNDIEAALIAARSDGPLTWLGMRLPWLARIYRLAWIKAANIDNPREAKTVAGRGLQTGTATRPGPQAGEAAQVNCAVLVDFYAPPVVAGADKAHHRRSVQRGLALAMMNGNILVESSPVFDKFLDWCTYLGYMRAPSVGVPAQRGPWRMRIQDRTQASAAIADLTVDALNDRFITVTAALGALTDGQRVKIQGVKFPAFVNRVWTNIGNAAGPPYHFGTSRRRLAGVFSRDGRPRATVVNSQLVAPTQYTVIGLRNRQTSGSFSRTPGRRRGG